LITRNITVYPKLIGEYRACENEPRVLGLPCRCIIEHGCALPKFNRMVISKFFENSKL